MPLPSVEQFIGTDVTEQGFKDAQKQFVEYVGIEVPTKTEVNASITAVSGGHKAYQTLAAAQAAQGSLPVNTIVEVTNDGANNGTYQWNGTTLTKSTYDPLTQAKAYTDTEIAKGFVLKANLGTAHLDTIVTTGIYSQISDASATTANGYPDTRAGTLEVVKSNAVISQIYTTWFGRVFWRTKYGSYAFQAWQEVASQKWITGNYIAIKPNLTTENLDTITNSGLYRQLTDANATLANNYPDTRAGTLDVKNLGNFVVQEYTTWYGKKFWRTKYGTYNFLVWQEVMPKSGAVLPYSGKTIAWFGDSIVNGNSHPTQVGDKIGATVLKFGFNSCTMSKNAGSPDGYDKLTMYRFAKAINTGDFTEVLAGADWLKTNSGIDFTAQAQAMAATDWNTVDYIVIAFGTNDWAGSTPLGSNYTADPTASTYIGAACYVIETILARYPHINIMFNGMAFRTRYFNTTPEINSDTITDAEGKYLMDYQDALINVGAKYHVPVFDFYRNSGINIFNYTQYYSDGVHPNTTGTALWVKKLTAFLLAN